MRIRKITELIPQLYEKAWLPVFTIGTIADYVSTRTFLTRGISAESNELANYLMGQFGMDTGLVLTLASLIPVAYIVGKIGRYAYNFSPDSMNMKLLTGFYRDKRTFTFFGLGHAVAALGNLYIILKA